MGRPFSQIAASERGGEHGSEQDGEQGGERAYF